MKVLKFYASWCAPCKGLSMVVEGIKDQVEIPFEDVNIEEQMELAAKYGIRSVPTMVIVDESGTEIKRQSGMLNEEQLLAFIDVE
jgi:thioredoxin 1